MFLFDLLGKKSQMPAPEDILPDRGHSLEGDVSDVHAVLGTSTKGPWPGTSVAVFGLGCFWGAERLFWTLDGVVSTQVGYAAGTTKNPTYKDVCSGRTGHNEVVRVVFDDDKIDFADLVKVFFEAHDPTQGMRQGNDVGTQYRSGIYPTTEADVAVAQQMRQTYDAALQAQGKDPVTTEIVANVTFYFAEDDHQQYLHKVPDGYCGLRGTGVVCPAPVSTD